ncbi:MAG TPA: hypothetical protein PKD78_10530 [Saprospiraceae bacterium]|nr:hypothetical protein [Saprospiraceae bacterium]
MRKLSLLLSLFWAASPLFAQSNSDCVSAMDICKKQMYNVAETGGEGRNTTEGDATPCFMNGTNYGQAEENSTWIKFEIAKSGYLTFVITPHKADNDIDFVVYKLPPTGDCRFKQIVRCMASGDSQFQHVSSPCMGQTGLREGQTDSSEDAGCSDQGDDAWLAPLRVEKGEKYVMLISNVTEAGPGFNISFAGTCKLPCDDEKPKKEKAKKETTPPVKKEQPKKQPDVVAKPKTSPKPDTIGGREVEVSEVVKVKTRTIKVKIWDSQIEDGDIISIYLNDKKVVDRLSLRIKPTEYTFELPPGNEHYLTVYADSFGRSEPNTARVVINDGTREQTIDLVAGRKKQESVKIVTE